MARPLAAVPAIKPAPRGNSLVISYNFRGIQFKAPTKIEVEKSFVGTTGFIKSSHDNHVDLNQQLEAIIDRYKLATTIALGVDDLTSKRVASEFDRLTKEAADLQATKALAAKVDAVRPRLSAYGSYAVADEIEKMKQDLDAKQAEYDNLMRVAGRYQDDKFITFVLKYMAAKPSSKSTKRNYNCFIKVLQEYSPYSRVQDISEDWIIAFVNWLFVTPITLHYYHMKRVDGKLTRTDKVKSTKVSPPRLNGTISDYVMKIKSVLNHFSTRTDKLPAGVSLDMSYKNYSFDLAAKQNNGLSMSWEEVCELFALTRFEKRTHEKARDLFVFLCATGLRQSDLSRVTPDAIRDGEIVLVNQKTQQHQIEAKIPINDISAAILHKYDYNIAGKAKMRDTDLNDRITEILNYKRGDHYVLASFQKTETIIQYRELEEIKKQDTRANLISSHCGRRTFINYCLDNGIDCTDVMLMSGHRHLPTLLVYKDKRKSMKKQMKGLFPVPEHLLPTNLTLA